MVICEFAGLTFCLLLAIGAAWWGRHTMNERSALAWRTTSSSSALQCRIRQMTGDRLFVSGVPEGFGRGRESDLCKKVFIPIPDNIIAEDSFVHEAETLLLGTPMANFLPALSRHEQSVAAFAVGIAKKESDWGRHAPQLDGRDCYNYWGYKGRGTRGSSGGYACFASPEEAVDTVVGRIADLVQRDKRDTPAKMVVWKCGSSCAWDNPVNVSRWISDVGLYYHKLASG